MKRFHVHVHVDNLSQSIGFYSKLFAAEPADEGQTTCCYARSEKHWVTDPQGIAWEHFHTLAKIPVFNEAASAQPRGKPVAIAVKAAGSSCC
jgi:hypothetical protein